MPGSCRILAAALLGLLCSACSVTRHIPEGQYFLQKVKIEDDRSTPRKERITASDMEKYVRQTPNKRYLGTTIYTAGDISQILELPKGVIPLTTVVLGYPDESPELTDRLPLDAVVHCEKYHHYTSSEIDELWAEKETSEETRRLLEENGLPNLAQIFTRNRYRAEDNLAISRNYFALLKKQGFFNN